jgi:hypothetical protein
MVNFSFRCWPGWVERCLDVDAARNHPLRLRGAARSLPRLALYAFLVVLAIAVLFSLIDHIG